jgi:hypothetical protein
MQGISPQINRLIETLLESDDVQAAILFGSRARARGDSPADADSDVDLQVVVKHPGRWIQREWAAAVLPAEELRAWSVRNAFGGVHKVSILLTRGELDLVFVPAQRMRWARWGIALGVHRLSVSGMRKLGDLELLTEHGYRVLKGGRRWENFWRKISTDVTPPGLSDAEVRNLADGVKVDLVSIHHKLNRGEIRAAQRWLHTGIAETNFRLMYELRRRRGEPAFHDARRAESVMDAASLARITVSAELEAQALKAAAEKAAQATTELVSAILDSRSTL